MKRGLLWSTLMLFMIIIFSFNFVFAETESNLTYDNNGNLIQGFGKYYEYNNFNQLERVLENDLNGRVIAKYFYDQDGIRILKQEFYSDGTNQSTYYIGKSFVQVRNNSGIFNFTYYYDESDLIAEKGPNGEINYYHPDHLGSTTLITDEEGDVVEETFYLPYGEIAEGGNDRYLFTGKEKDNETKLYYYGSRYYNSFFRHFIQPDNVISDIYNPQQLNRYSYTLNNPYTYKDPTGESPILAIGAASAGVGFIGSVLYQAYQANWDYSQVSLSQAGITAASTAIGFMTFGLASTSMSTALSAQGLGSIATGIGAGTFAGVGAGEAGLITGSVLSGNLNTLADPIAHAEAMGYGGLIGGTLVGIGTMGSSFGSNVGKSIFTSTTKGSALEYVREDNLPSGVSSTANKFFTGATGKSNQFNIVKTNTGYKFNFFSPANTPGYGKSYNLETDLVGKITERVRYTLGPNGEILKTTKY